MGLKMDRQIQMEKFKNWFEDIAASTLYVLHEKEGFGRKRLDRFWQNWYTLWENIENNRIASENIKKILKDKCGITFKKF